jgi:hypothetical protein
VSFFETIGLGAAFLIIAALYASVGQAGASGYLAVMGLAGLDPVMMKPIRPADRSRISRPCWDTPTCPPRPSTLKRQRTRRSASSI